METNNNTPYPPAPPPYSYQQHGSDYASYPQVDSGDRQWGTPVMGAPANPSSHPDNQHAATVGLQDSNSIASSFRQSSGSFDVKQSQTQSVPTTSGTNPVGQGPQSPYFQGSTTGQKGTMDKIVEQVNQMGKKVEVVAGNVWSHLSTGSSVTDAAWGRLTAGTKVLTEGGFEKVFKSTFPVDADEVLKKTYACYLSTSTGPVAGTLYISSKKFAFCSDRPLSYTPSAGQQAFSYYKVVVPLDRLQDVKPSVNQNKPAEKYIQVNTVDNYEFWFMGFVNYDKGVTNMQAALRDRGTTPTTTNPQQQPPTSQNSGSHNQVYPLSTDITEGINVYYLFVVKSCKYIKRLCSFGPLWFPRKLLYCEKYIRIVDVRAYGFLWTYWGLLHIVVDADRDVYHYNNSLNAFYSVGLISHDS